MRTPKDPQTTLLFWLFYVSSKEIQGESFIFGVILQSA
jgi:hypothetical protein